MAATRIHLLAVSMLLLLSVTNVAPSAAQLRPELAADYSSAVLTGNLRGPGKAPFRLEIDCVPSAGLESSSGTQSLVYLGTDGESPRCIVSKLRLTIAGKPVQFPKRGVEDLANAAIPSGVYLTTRAEAVVLHVQGGDGSGAYKARFFIEGGRVTVREIERLDQEGKPQVKREDLRTKQ